MVKILKPDATIIKAPIITPNPDLFKLLQQNTKTQKQTNKNKYNRNIKKIYK